VNLARLYAERICPACGFKLDFTPWQNGVATERPCLCCGIYFGYDDADESGRESIYLLWRQRWIEGGRRWWASREQPADFNPPWQLARLEVLEK
jgi:hypothetical protein